MNRFISIYCVYGHLNKKFGITYFEGKKKHSYPTRAPVCVNLHTKRLTKGKLDLIYFNLYQLQGLVHFCTRCLLLYSLQH